MSVRRYWKLRKAGFRFEMQSTSKGVVRAMGKSLINRGEIAEYKITWVINSWTLLSRGIK